MITQDKRLIGILVTVAVLLSIPLVAMQFSKQVSWSLFDFGIMSGLLLGTGLTCEFVLRKVKKNQHRIAICIGIMLILFLVWAELGLGVFGSTFAGS